MYNPTLTKNSESKKIREPLVNIHKLYNVVLTPFRKKRMARFISTFLPKESDEILDIGGTAFNWTLINYKYPITLLNLDVPDNASELPENYTCVAGDGTALEYADNSFAIVFSNSVIEHVGTYEKQMAFAKEACRVGKKIWIQTPAKCFFFEPHYLMAFVHWFPKKCQKKMLRFSGRALLSKFPQEEIDDLVDYTRLLSFAECQELFPNCSIHKEKILFFTKSYIIENS